VEQRNCGRIRYWTSKDSKVELLPDCSVLPRHLHGGDRARSKVLSGRNRSERSGKRAKTKILFPPSAGWKGGSPEANGRGMTETYGSGGTMPRSQVSNLRRTIGC
jgi:hypothetical protein